MVSALYVVLGALLLIKLSLDVVKLRTQYRVAAGDGGFYELQTAIRVHGNAVEYIPIGLILFVLLEMNGSPNWILHICGLMLMTGRLMHSYGLRTREYRWRRAGMSATYCSLVLMVLLDLWFIPWDVVLSWQ
ncbi:hypothetical protein CE195_00960 [Sodalis-like symbiont of Philaenus spumarius]|nr:hypothetical protein CE195_01615 [Sodalis-like symbiont of Philaenus spumarius]OZI15519.1 hypothetical protein CE195_00960 [Sodalis-like symbiont of Philaenus spumarius]